MKKTEYVLGVLGGMGTYATIHLFQQYAEMFPAEKEWDRPRIIIDNNCTMPSRVRAVLYNENWDELVARMAESIRILIEAGATQIILGCNTSHVFLEDVYKTIPEARAKVINIIDACVSELKEKRIKTVYLLATEGTIISGEYNKKLDMAGIRCDSPLEEEFSKLRLCIEAVKQNKYDNEVKNVFLDFISRGEACVLGCTELPILYDHYERDVLEIAKEKPVLDPLYLALKQAHTTFEQY